MRPTYNQINEQVEKRRCINKGVYFNAQVWMKVNIIGGSPQDLTHITNKGERDVGWKGKEKGGANMLPIKQASSESLVFTYKRVLISDGHGDGGDMVKEMGSRERKTS